MMWISPTDITDYRWVIRSRDSKTYRLFKYILKICVRNKNIKLKILTIFVSWNKFFYFDWSISTRMLCSIKFNFLGLKKSYFWTFSRRDFHGQKKTSSNENQMIYRFNQKNLEYLVFSNPPYNKKAFFCRDQIALILSFIAPGWFLNIHWKFCTCRTNLKFTAFRYFVLHLS